MRASPLDNRAAIGRRAVLAGAGAAAGLAAGGLHAARAQSREKLRVLVATSPPDPASHYYFYARENGFYEKHGIDVDLQSITAETTAIRALVAGDGDIAAFCGSLAPIQAFNSGARVRFLSTFVPKLDYQIIAVKDIADLKHLEGRTFAVSQVGTVSQFVPSLMMKQIGADPSAVNWVSVGSSAARLQAVIGRTVEAAAVNASLAVRGLAYDYLHVIANAADVLPKFLYGCDITSVDMGAKRMPALKAFVAACGDGVRWAMSNPEKAVAVSQKILPEMPPGEVKTAINLYIDKKFWNASGEMSREIWDFTVNSAHDAGLITAVPAYNDFVLR
jgi:NitT/TauT family transport system substrate-binding protein